MKLTIACLVFASSAIRFAAAQTLTVDHLTQSQLIEKAQDLNEKAKGPDAASSKLNEYPNHFTMIALRHQDGRAEVHENYAHVFFVVQGSAKLLTGGTVAGWQHRKPGRGPRQIRTQRS